MTTSLTDDPAIPPPPPAKPTGIVLWNQRLKLVVEVVFFVELGMLLIVLPWTPVWSQNPLLATHYNWHDFLDSGFVRGAVTGLGLVNLWVGISDALSYHES